MGTIIPTDTPRQKERARELISARYHTWSEARQGVETLERLGVPLEAIMVAPHLPHPKNDVLPWTVREWFTQRVAAAAGLGGTSAFFVAVGTSNPIMVSAVAVAAAVGGFYAAPDYTVKSEGADVITAPKHNPDLETILGEDEEEPSLEIQFKGMGQFLTDPAIITVKEHSELKADYDQMKEVLLRTGGVLHHSIVDGRWDKFTNLDWGTPD